MTLIECLDRIPLENIIGGFYLKPDKILFTGQQDNIESESKRYRRFFSENGLEPKVEFVKIDADDIDGMTAILSEIIEKEGDCVFDINGGETPVILALGAVYERLKDKYPIRVFKDTNEFSDANISIRSFISLYGGTILPNEYRPDTEYDAENIKDFWEFVRKNPKAWNKRATVLNEFEKNKNGESFVLDMKNFKNSMRDFVDKQITFKNTLAEFDRFGFIKNLSGKKIVKYTYTDPLIRYCAKKAGNILELKCFFEAKNLTIDGKRFFNDCEMGVVIDWDGVIHKHGTQETRNEIDILALRGLTPLFISCKNGNVEEAELYKLSSVAERFGGKYARKMLVLTDSSHFDYAYFEAVKQRAKEMNIFIIPNAAKLNNAGWKNAFMDALKGNSNE